MKNFLAFLILFVTFLQAENLVDCNQVFEARKDEILRELDKLDEKQEEFEAYKEAKLNLIKEKEKKLQEREEEVKKALKKAEDYKKEVLILKEMYNKKEDDINKMYLFSFADVFYEKLLNNLL